jgi:cytochrome c556
MRKILVAGCLAGASFFIGCNQNATTSADKKAEDKNLEMYEESELAALMRQMYDTNLELKKKLENGEMPASFPEDFYTLHDAVATKGMISEKNRSTFEALADQYKDDLKEIENAATPAQAKIAYNEMVMTCASCHQIYCQGPLPKIKRLSFDLNE